MSKRLEYIDVMRGIAILLVIFEHCIGSLNDTTARLILSFHMPLFFFISGCLLKPITGGVIVFFVKKCKALLLPQITLALLSLFATILFDVLLKQSITINDVNILKPFGAWFLIALFLMEMIAVPMISIIKNRKVLAGATLLILGIFSITDYVGIMFVQQTLAALVFGLLGYLCKPWVDCFNELQSKAKGFGWIVLLIVALLSMLNEPIAMYLNLYGIKWLFVITSLLGIYAILDISVSIKNTAFFQYCGRESIILYVLQFCVIRIVLAVCTIFIPSFEYYQYPCFIISFLISMFVLIPMTWICAKYLKFAFGR